MEKPQLGLIAKEGRANFQTKNGKRQAGGEVKGCLGIRDRISHQGSPSDDHGCWGCVFSGELKLTVPNGTLQAQCKIQNG